MIMRRTCIDRPFQTCAKYLTFLSLSICTWSCRRNEPDWTFFIHLIRLQLLFRETYYTASGNHAFLYSTIKLFHSLLDLTIFSCRTKTQFYMIIVYLSSNMLRQTGDALSTSCFLCCLGNGECVSIILNRVHWLTCHMLLEGLSQVLEFVVN